RLSGGRRHASRQRAADDLRIGADHRAAYGGGPVVARNLGRTGQARPADARARDRGGIVSGAVLDTLDRPREAAPRREGLPVGVIGGGLGGLAAACTLAARGHLVVLFEKNHWLGGKAGCCTKAASASTWGRR